MSLISDYPSMFKKAVIYTVLTVSLGMATLLAPNTYAQSAQHITIDPPQASSDPDRVEVLEFFAYTCPHCANIAPMTETWVKTLPETVVFNRVPVAFNAGGTDLQKLYYSLEAMGRLDLHAKVFHAIHKERKRIYDFKAISGWIESQGVDQKEFESVFQSFGVDHKVKQANDLVKRYQVDSTPSIAVGGMYVTTPGLTKSYAGTIGHAQKLLNKILGTSK